MTMTFPQAVITVAMVVLGTLITRFLPFVLFPASKPTPAYVRYLGQDVYFDKDGIVVESSTQELEGIPQISGVTFDSLAIHQPLSVEDPTIFDTILSITKLLTKYDLDPDEIRFGAGGELFLQLGDVKVALGTGENLDEKISRLKQLEGDLKDKSGTLHMENYTDETTHISLESAK